MDGTTPDARPASPGPNWRERRVAPRYARVWVRVQGTWRKGRIVAWVTYPRDRTGWECVIAADDPMDALPWQGRYIYDSLTIRPRHGDVPPA